MLHTNVTEKITFKKGMFMWHHKVKKHIKAHWGKIVLALFLCAIMVLYAILWV